MTWTRPIVFRDKACKKCNRMFSPRWATVRYCSAVCARREQCICQSCGREFKRSHGTHGKYCSRHCKKAAQAWPEGATKPNYRGYITIKVKPGTPGAWPSDKQQPWMLEHRFVMQQAIGRALLATESVHHKNGDRTDNRLGNLELWNRNHSDGVRASDYHCAGCRCHQLVPNDVLTDISATVDSFIVASHLAMETA